MAAEPISSENCLLNPIFCRSVLSPDLRIFVPSSTDSFNPAASSTELITIGTAVIFPITQSAVDAPVFAVFAKASP